MDIQDYLSWGFIGEEQLPITDINWEDAYTTFKATKDAHFKAVREYYRTSVELSSIDRRYNIIDRYSEILKAKSEFEASSIIFWSSMISLNYQDQGLNEGDKITKEDGIYYKIFTEEIYNTYISDLKNNMLALKNLLKVCSSGETFEIYTRPDHKIHDFSSFSGDFSYQINNYANFNNWDGTYRIVTEGGVSVGSHVYYLLPSGYKNTLRVNWNGDGNGTFTMVDLSDNSLTIDSNGIVTGIDNGFTFDSTTNYTAPVI